MITGDNVATSDSEQIEKQRSGALEGLKKSQAFMSDEIFEKATAEANRDFDALIAKAEKTSAIRAAAASKNPVPPNVKELRPYYEGLIAKYLPTTVKL